jgi:protein-tyrosine phosphatase
MARKLLVVCLGNICRSPMAKVVLQRELGEGWEIDSAGLGALVGEPAVPEALQALARIGLDASAHRARQLDSDLLREAELVLVMETAQKIEVERIYPWACGRVFLLGHWEGIEIEDPYRRPQEIFDQTLALIERCGATWPGRLA